MTAKSPQNLLKQADALVTKLSSIMMPTANYGLSSPKFLRVYSRALKRAERRYQSWLESYWFGSPI